MWEISRLRRRRQRTRRVKRNRRHELKNVLRNRPRSARLSGLSQGLRCRHNSMDTGLEIHRYRLLRPFCTCSGCCAGGATAIPDTSKLVPGNNLGQKTSRDMSHFDESRVKEEDIWPMHGHSFRSALPLNRARGTAWRSMFVHVDAEFWEPRKHKTG